MKLIICAFFSIIFAAFVIGVDSVEIVKSETKITDEYGYLTSLMYDGAELTIVCISQSEPELVVGGSVVPAKVEKMSSDRYNFTLKIDNEMKLGDYWCKEKGQTGVVSEKPLKVMYKLCSDSNDKCQQSVCSRLGERPFCAITSRVEMCSRMDIDLEFDLHPYLYTVCVENNSVETFHSLFDAFSNFEKPIFEVDLASGPRNPCTKKLEFIDKDSQRIFMASAVLYSDNINVILSCTDTKVMFCKEVKKGNQVIQTFSPVCGTFLKLSEKRPEQVGSLITKLTCYGASHDSADDRYTTHIFIVQMDTAHFFNDSASCLLIAPERKLLCGFMNPPSGSGFSVTASLSFNGTQLSTQSGHVAQFDVKDVGEYECQLTIKFKSCAMVMRSAFSKTVSSKFVLKEECFPTPTTTSVSSTPIVSFSNTPIAVEYEKSITTNIRCRFKSINYMCVMLALVFLIIYV